MMLSLGFVVAAVSYFGLRKIHNRWRTFLIWMVFSGLFLSFVATFSLTVKDTQWFYNYEMWLSSKIDQLTAGQKKKSSDSDSDSDCSTSECKAVKRFTSLERYGVNLLNALNVAWLFLAIGMVTLLLIWGKKYLLSDKTKKPSLMIAYSSIGIMIWLWMLAMSTFWGVVRNNLPPGIIRVSLVEAGLPLMGLNWLIILVLGIGFFIVWLCRLHWCKNNSTKMYDLKNTPLRLLVAPFVQAILLGISILAAIFIIRLWIGALMGNMPNQDMVLLNKGTKIAISILGIISFVGTFLMTSLQAGLDICQDVISYFRFTSANDTTEGNNKNYKTRQRILNRVRTVLKILVDQENPDKVTVVAHSQGTVFAIEVLQEDWITTLGDKKINWNFITMGSPFTHLYQHYFPESFPFPIKLRKFMSCWLNIFRIDDFVGTHINGEKGWPENIPVDQGGHTGYWADKNVVEILRRTIL